ncbi:MAG: ATP-dependent sacrificial sulfur transferase LarE [Microthrixaceae bacterium]
MAATTPLGTESAAAPDGRIVGLREALAATGPVVVAFSGGVDSALLAHTALDTLGVGAVLAVTARSASLATGELDHCRDLAAAWGLPWRAVDTDELSRPDYVRNDLDRCARCKDALMDALEPLARGRAATVALGVNVDDLGEHRPGQEVARARGARFPLVEAGLTKADVRAAARAAALPVWDRPAMPCLASRIPHGTPVTVELLGAVDRAESALRGIGLRDVRVRHLGRRARVEVGADQLDDATARAERLEAVVRAAGFDEVELDPRGLRSGNLVAEALAAAGGATGG